MLLSKISMMKGAEPTHFVRRLSLFNLWRLEWLKIKKGKTYIEAIRDIAMMVKDIGEKSLVLAEADKKKVEDNLAHMRTMYTKLKTSTNQIKYALQKNYDN